MIETTIPSYAAVSSDERGASFGLSFEDWRMLSRTALGATASVEGVFMAIYLLPESKGAALDIFSVNKLLTIKVDSKAEQIALLSVGLDSIAEAACLLSTDKSGEGWRQLGQLAQMEIKAS